MSEARHPFVTVRVRSEQLELAQLRLWELGATGLEERDQTTLVRDAGVGRSRRHCGVRGRGVGTVCAARNAK